MSCFEKEKETLCFSCQNCTRCSWADGIPVKGWEATPTIVHDCDGDFGSYNVTKCPIYKEDEKKEVTRGEIAQLLGVKHWRVVDMLSTQGGIIFLRHFLKKKGYKFIISRVIMRNGKEKREFMIEKINKGGDK